MVQLCEAFNKIFSFLGEELQLFITHTHLPLFQKGVCLICLYIDTITKGEKKMYLKTRTVVGGIIFLVLTLMVFYNINVNAQEIPSTVWITAISKVRAIEVDSSSNLEIAQNIQVKAIHMEKQESEEEKMIRSIQSKLRMFPINPETNMRETIGFTVSEMKYILTHIEAPKYREMLVTDEERAEKIALSMIVSMRKYQVNELVTISIMAWETGWLRGNPEAVAKNNFGGLKKDGILLSYDNVEIGIDRYISTISNNLKENFRHTADSYCRETAEKNQQWADGVYDIFEDVSLEIMKW